MKNQNKTCSVFHIIDEESFLQEISGVAMDEAVAVFVAGNPSFSHEESAGSYWRTAQQT